MPRGTALFIGILFGVISILITIVLVQFLQQPKGDPNIVCPHTLPRSPHHVHVGLTARPVGTQVSGARIHSSTSTIVWVQHLLHSFRAAGVNLDGWSVVDLAKEGHQVIAVSQDAHAFRSVLQVFLEDHPDVHVELMPGIIIHSAPHPGGLLSSSQKLMECIPHLPLRVLLPSERGETVALFHHTVTDSMPSIIQHIRACM